MYGFLQASQIRRCVLATKGHINVGAEGPQWTPVNAMEIDEDWVVGMDVEEEWWVAFLY